MKSKVNRDRRNVVAALGACTVTSMAWATAKSPGEQRQDPRAARLLAGSLKIDMHSHIPVNSANDDFDLAGGMRAGQFDVVCGTYPVDATQRPAPGQWYREYVGWTDQLDALLAKQSMRRALRAEDLDEAVRMGQPVVVQAAEGGQWVDGKLERIAELHARGLRHMQLFHSMQDISQPMGDLQTLDPQFGGLTPLGRETIKECNRLGLVVDLAHGNFNSIRQAIEVSSSPIIFSHAALLSPKGLGQVPEWADRRLPMRLLRPDDAKAIAAAGGIFGIWHIFPSLKDYVAAIRETVDLIGPDHVGIGTDTSVVGGGFVPSVNRRWPDEKGGFMSALVEGLLASGFTEEDVRKVIGGNYRRVFAAAVRVA